MVRPGVLVCSQCHTDIEYPDNFCAGCGASSVAQLLNQLYQTHLEARNLAEATDVALHLADLAQERRDAQSLHYWLGRVLETDASNDMARRWQAGQDVPELMWRRKVWTMKYAPTVLWRVVLERQGMWPPPNAHRALDSEPVQQSWMSGPSEPARPPAPPPGPQLVSRPGTPAGPSLPSAPPAGPRPMPGAPSGPSVGPPRPPSAPPPGAQYAPGPPGPPPGPAGPPPARPMSGDTTDLPHRRGHQGAPAAPGPRVGPGYIPLTPTPPGPAPLPQAPAAPGPGSRPPAGPAAGPAPVLLPNAPPGPPGAGGPRPPQRLELNPVRENGPGPMIDPSAPTQPNLMGAPPVRTPAPGPGPGPSPMPATTPLGGPRPGPSTPSFPGPGTPGLPGPGGPRPGPAAGPAFPGPGRPAGPAPPTLPGPGIGPGPGPMPGRQSPPGRPGLPPRLDTPVPMQRNDRDPVHDRIDRFTGASSGPTERNTVATGPQSAPPFPPTPPAGPPRPGPAPLSSPGTTPVLNAAPPPAGPSSMPTTPLAGPRPIAPGGPLPGIRPPGPLPGPGAQGPLPGPGAQGPGFPSPPAAPPAGPPQSRAANPPVFKQAPGQSPSAAPFGEETGRFQKEADSPETVSLRGNEGTGKLTIDPSEYAPSPPKVQTDKAGVNLILNLPRKQGGLVPQGPRLQVIYGNFAPTDPKEIVFWVGEGEGRPIGLSFSRSAGEGIYHVQLNHYTVSPDVHAELVFKQGVVYLVSRVLKGSENRYEIRVNGVPMPPRDTRKLAPGDMVTLGIFRLKWPGDK